MSLPDVPADPPLGAVDDGVRDRPAVHADAPVPPSPTVADGARRRLDPRIIPLDRVVWSLTTAVVSLFLFLTAIVLLVALPGPWFPVLVIGGCFALIGTLGFLSYFWPGLEYRYASYSVDAQGIEIRRGVVWRRVVAVPRSRVQHIDVSQGPLERLFGLGTMRIYTAGTAYARVALRGLDHVLALGIRDHLLPQGSSDAV